MPRHKDAEREQVMSQTRQLLLEAAADEFARQGYAGANINRISRAAGFAKGTIYNYFSSKRALMLALIDTIAETHLNLILGEVRKEEDPARQLECFFEAGFTFVSRYLAQGRVMLNTIYGPDAEFKIHAYNAYQPMFQFVSQEVIAPGIARGIFRQVEPDATAALLMTIYLGTASQVDEKGQPWLVPAQVADFALNALRK
ncbi:MAG: TetR/AcrR family transcriptional regulator [Anaerolineae bacterium]|nr:MAG: TetR/AcrR family transcriptional regulator [Anaerolineae bacterium]